MKYKLTEYWNIHHLFSLILKGEILDINDGSDMAEANVITTSDNGDDDNDDYDMKVTNALLLFIYKKQ